MLPGIKTHPLNLTREPVPKLIRSIAVPASVGFFFNTMFNIVDTYFGGTISTQALAALSLSFPVFFIILALGSGFATGTTALIATALGASLKPQAKMFAIQGITFGVLMSMGITVLGIWSSPWLFTMLGASGEYLAMCLVYMDIIFLGTVFFILNFMLNAILNALGDTRSFRNFLIVSFFLNIVLDFWFIYGGAGVPPMGIAGIAVATILIQALGSVYLGFQVSRTELICDRCSRDMIPKLHVVKEIARQGIPSSMNLMTVGLGVFVITYFISSFGKEAVAAYGVAIRIEQLVLLPTIGLNIATVTIVAQNNGARLYERINEVVRTALAYGGVLMVMGTIVMFFLSPHLMKCFTDDPLVVDIGTVYLRIASFLLYAYVILFVNVAALQGLKQPMYGLIIGFIRQVALPVPIFYFLGHYLDLGLISIWWGIFAINWSSAMATFFYARAVLIKTTGALS